MALTTNLAAYWSFDSSLTADSVGSNTLTNNNTVGTGAGFLGAGSADFGTANTNKSLTRSDACGVTGTDLSISLWVKMRTEIGSGTQVFMAHGQNANNAISLRYDYNGGTRQLYSTNFSTGNAFYETARSNQTLGTSNWQHIAVTKTTGASGMIMYFNGSQIGTGNGATGISGGLRSTTNIGVYDDFGAGSPTYSSYISAYIDEVGLWSRVLTPTEITQLYNGGAGLAYPFVSGRQSRLALLGAA